RGDDEDRERGAARGPPRHEPEGRAGRPFAPPPHERPEDLPAGLAELGGSAPRIGGLAAGKRELPPGGGHREDCGPAGRWTEEGSTPYSFRRPRLRFERCAPA